jgi:hypothetical protein
MSRPSQSVKKLDELLQKVTDDAQKQSDPDAPSYARLMKLATGLANAKARLSPGKRKKKLKLTDNSVGSILR